MNAEQVEAAGYIDLAGGNITYLDSIFQGLVTIASSDAISTAINNSIPIYNHYQSIETTDRDFSINIAGISGTHSGVSYVIDSQKNNSHYVYDSLLVQGLTQNAAITNITADQSLHSSAVTLTNGQINVSMQPNAVQLLQFVIPELVGVQALETDIVLKVFPNPVSNELTVESDQTIGKVELLSVTGKVMDEFEVNDTSFAKDLSTFPSGIYYLHFSDWNRVVKVVHQ